MKPNKYSKCDVCATPFFERNNYFYGKQFTVRDLLQEQAYFNEKRHLVNRMVLGWGVVCGLDVRWVPEEREFIVETGMALDCCGREIIVCEPQHVAFEDYDEHCRYARERPEHEGKFVLCLEYDDCNSEPVELPAVGCDDQERIEFNRVRDSFKLRIRKWEDACPKQPYDHFACLNRFKDDVKDLAGGSEGRKCRTHTIHEDLCREIKKKCHQCEECDCVALGTIYVKAVKPAPTRQQPQGPKDYPKQHEKQNYEQQGYEPKQVPVEVYIDTCTDRRFVYNNSLLYDLIYCHHGDLPHVVDFNWRKHTYPTREVGIDTFLQMMKEGLTVYFDQEMAPPSLNEHTFIVSYLHRDTGTSAYVENRIPVKEISVGKSGDCYTATFVATERWINKELDADDSELRASLPNVEPGVNVEITLRGSRIWSTQGKGLDGDYLADKLPTGNGTQGGDFVDWFRVMPPSAKTKAKPYDY